jgi:hypothetical protein
MSTTYSATTGVKRAGLRRKIGGAVGALALTVGALAALSSVASPTANAMRAECEAHMRAAGWAYDHGMDDVGDTEYYAWVDCMNRG